MTAKKFLLPLLAGGLAMTLAACGGPAPTQTATDSASPGASAPATSAPAQSEGWDINETPRDQVADGGEFKGSISFEISTWNTFSVAGNEASLNDLVAPIRPRYFNYLPSGDPETNTDYLESFTENVADGKLSVSLKLNPNAKWNDGDPIDVDDWIATWKAMNGSDEDFTAASTEGWVEIDSIAAGADKFEVLVTFKSTYPDWTALFGDGPLRAEGVKDAKTFNEGWADYNNDWFSGPFYVTNWDKTSGTVTQEPNPNWWGDKPKLDKVTWKLVPSEASAAAFANQEIDFLDIGPDPNGYQLASSAPNSEVRSALGPNFRHFTFNSKAPNLSDVNVRQAIVKGLDRAQIAASDLAGLPLDFRPLNNNIFVENQTGYVDLGAETGIDYDPEGAKAQLDAAGWALNESTGFREKDGKQLDVTFAVLGGVAASENEGLQAQNMLKEIGVNLILNTIDTTTDWPNVLYEYKFDIIAFSWIGTPYPLRGIDQIYGGTTKDGKFTPNDSNFAQLDVAKVNELTPKIAVEMDHDARLAMGQEAAKAIWESVHTLPLYQRPDLIAVRDTLANYGSFGMGEPRWTDVGYTTLD